MDGFIRNVNLRPRDSIVVVKLMRSKNEWVGCSRFNFDSLIAWSSPVLDGRWLIFISKRWKRFKGHRNGFGRRWTNTVNRSWGTGFDIGEFSTPQSNFGSLSN